MSVLRGTIISIWVKKGKHYWKRIGLSWNLRVDLILMKLISWRQEANQKLRLHQRRQDVLANCEDEAHVIYRDTDIHDIFKHLERVDIVTH